MKVRDADFIVAASFFEDQIRIMHNLGTLRKNPHRGAVSDVSNLQSLAYAGRWT